MFIYKRASLPLPRFPNLASFTSRIALGGLLFAFLLGYQPTLGFPPVKQSIVKAQIEQGQTIEAQSLPFIAQLPHPGYLSTYFSNYHPGIDIATGLGMPIKPIAKGIVVEAGFNIWGLGLMVLVDHGSGYHSLYAHMGKTYVKPGQEVNESSFLGEVGMTGHTSGPHTHLEITKNGNYIDPLSMLPEIRKQPIAQDFTPIGTPSASTSKPVVSLAQNQKSEKVTDKLDIKAQLAKSL